MYTLGPRGGVAVPMPWLRSLFLPLVQDFNSIGGDPSRNDIHFTQGQSIVNTIWADRWWTTAQGAWQVNWEQKAKSSMTLEFEFGRNVVGSWGMYLRPGDEIGETLSLEPMIGMWRSALATCSNRSNPHYS